MSKLKSTIPILIASLAAIIGVLNYSPDDSILYRRLVHVAFSSSFQYGHGCFCMFNELDGTGNKYGPKCGENSNNMSSNSNIFENNKNAKECSSEIIILNNKFYKELVLRDELGFGESYVNKYWIYDNATYDLGDIVTEFYVGADGGDKSILDDYFVYLIISRWKEWYQRKYGITHTLEEDKNSVQYHYDLGNDIYESFLDSSMMYTCAVYNRQLNPTNNLTKAQINKLDVLIQKMEIDANDNVLDVGTGWGYTPYHINEQTNATAIGITIAANQYKYIETKFKTKINNQLNYKLLDYRNSDQLLKYNFNKIISIGVIAHIGKNIDQFWDITSRILDKNRNNIVGLQYNTFADISDKMHINRNTACESGSFFLPKHIFPGTCIMHNDWIQESAAKYGFTLIHQEFYGLHYAKTLYQWRMNWYKNGENVIRNNDKYNNELYRIYDYYFSSAEAMFRTGHITKVQQIYVRINNKSGKSLYGDMQYIIDNFRISHAP